MFFQEATPDTSGYMIAGYVITFVILGIYIASMYLRNRNYQQDLNLLEEMDQPAVQPDPTGKPKKKKGGSSTKKGKR